MPFQISSERLCQIPITMDYAKVIFDNFNCRITEYMLPKPPDTLSETEIFIKKAIETTAEGSNLQLVVLDKSTKEFLGCSGLHELSTNTPELGIWLKESAHGKAYGLEAIGALISWARNNISFDYIKYPVDKRNYPSKRIPEHFGGKIYGDMYLTQNQSGNFLEIVEYRIK